MGKNLAAIVFGGFRKATAYIYDGYESAIGRTPTPTTYHTSQGQSEEVQTVKPVQEKIVEPIDVKNEAGLIVATCDVNFKTGRKVPIEVTIKGGKTSLMVEPRSSFFQFIVSQQYKDNTEKEFEFSNIVRDEDEVVVYYNSVTEYAESKGYAVNFVK